MIDNQPQANFKIYLKRHLPSSIKKKQKQNPLKFSKLELKEYFLHKEGTFKWQFI